MSRFSRYFENPNCDDGPVNISPELIKARTMTCLDHILNNLQPTPQNCDGGLYVGVGGVSYSLYYLIKCGHFAEQKERLLSVALLYINSALEYIQAQNVSNHDMQVSYLLGNGGIYAVAALIYNMVGNKEACERYLNAYRELSKLCEPINFLECGSDELFVGRAGYLMGILVLQRDLQIEILPDAKINLLCTRIVESGRSYRKKIRHPKEFPLMYAYYDTMYLGAGHGLSGILQVLLSFPKFLAQNSEFYSDIKKTVDFLLSCEHDRNIVPTLEEMSDAKRTDSNTLIHWCHGAPGVVYAFARAYLVFDKEKKYLDSCKRFGDIIWSKGLLKKGPGICHGVAGNGYVFLLLYRLTSEPKYLYQAERFAAFMFTEIFSSGARTPDSPFSLYEGLAGTICFLNDLLQPDRAEKSEFHRKHKEYTAYYGLPHPSELLSTCIPSPYISLISLLFFNFAVQCKKTVKRVEDSWIPTTPSWARMPSYEEDYRDDEQVLNMLFRMQED